MVPLRHHVQHKGSSYQACRADTHQAVLKITDSWRKLFQ